MIYENDAWYLSAEEKELRAQISATGDEAWNEEDDLTLWKIINVVENHDDINLLYSGTGMYLIGMTFGWTALRVVHTRKAVLHYKKILGITTHSLALPDSGYEAAA
jgi:hypothetical protein